VNDPTNGHVGRDQVAHIGLRFDSSGIRQQRVSGRLTGASNSPSDTNGQLLACDFRNGSARLAIQPCGFSTSSEDFHSLDQRRAVVGPCAQRSWSAVAAATAFLVLVNTPLATREEQKWRQRSLAVVRPDAAGSSAAVQSGHLTAADRSRKAVAAATALQRRFAQVLRGVQQRLHLVYGRTQFFRPAEHLSNFHYGPAVGESAAQTSAFEVCATSLRSRT
jgi:hypothetical protein